jgi:hypothetical protein
VPSLPDGAEAAAERLSLPKFLRETGVDDRDGSSRVEVVVGEVAALEHRCTEGRRSSRG